MRASPEIIQKPFVSGGSGQGLTYVITVKDFLRHVWKKNDIRSHIAI